MRCQAKLAIQKYSANAPELVTYGTTNTSNHHNAKHQIIHKAKQINSKQPWQKIR